MSTPINDTTGEKPTSHEATGTSAATAPVREDGTTSNGMAGTSARHGAGLFDIRNIIGALMGLYGVILVVTSFMTSKADKAKANGENLNLWTGLGLLVLAAALIGWAVTRPIVVDEAELAADKAKADHEGRPGAH